MIYENHYLTLAIKPNASQEEISFAYKNRLKLCHPDILSSETELAKRLTQRINEAYEILSNEERRASYDSLASFRETEIIPNPASVLRFQKDKIESLKLRKDNLLDCENTWKSLYKKIRGNHLIELPTVSPEERLSALHDIDLAYNWLDSSEKHNFDGIQIRKIDVYEGCEWQLFQNHFPMIRFLNRDLISAIVGYGLMLETHVIEGSIFHNGFNLTCTKYQDPLIQLHILNNHSIIHNYSDWLTKGSDYWHFPHIDLHIRICSSHIESLKVLAEKNKINAEIDDGALNLFKTIIKSDIGSIIDLIYGIFCFYGFGDDSVIYIGDL